MTTSRIEIGAVTAMVLRLMRRRLEEAAAIAGAVEGCAADGQPARALTIALDIEPLAVEAKPTPAGSRDHQSDRGGDEQDEIAR